MIHGSIRKLKNYNFPLKDDFRGLWLKTRIVEFLMAEIKIFEFKRIFVQEKFKIVDELFFAKVAGLVLYLKKEVVPC